MSEIVCTVGTLFTLGFRIDSLRDSGGYGPAPGLLNGTAWLALERGGEAIGPAFAGALTESAEVPASYLIRFPGLTTVQLAPYAGGQIWGAGGFDVVWMAGIPTGEWLDWIAIDVHLP